MEHNIQTNQSIFQGCGDFKVWTDTGYLETKTKANLDRKLNCFFPTMHGGLEAFYQSHPNGTILNVLRDPDQWYGSAVDWRKLPERLSRTCTGFPPPRSSAAAWREFYRWHAQMIRDFVASHPSLTYLELSLEAEDTGKILEDHTGIPQVCWGDCNPDRNKEQCHVFQKMRDYTEEQARQPKKRGKQMKQSAWRKRGDGAKPNWSDIEEKFLQYRDQPVQAAHGKIVAFDR